MTLSLLAAAVLIGLMGAGHCATMCGPTTIALVSRTPKPKQPLAAHAGRILTYALLGALAATLTSEVTQFLRNEVFRTAWFLIPNLMLVLSALYLMGFQQAYAPVESVGRAVWARMRSARELVQSRGGLWGDLLRGGLWGFLPCGMVYSALGLAVLTLDPLAAALVMIAFGLSTLPVLLALGILSQQTLHKLKQPVVRRNLGIALLILAVWNVTLIPARVNGLSLSFFC